MEKNYRIELKVRLGPVHPAPMDLFGDAGRRVVMAAARRVMKEHADVIKALAKR